MGGARYRDNCVPGPREPVFRSLTLFSAVPWAGGVNLMIFPTSPKKGLYSTAVYDCSVSQRAHD